MAAQQFLWDNELDQEYLDTVAQFITKNVAPVTLGEVTSAFDPFSRPAPTSAGGASAPAPAAAPLAPPTPVSYFPNVTRPASFRGSSSVHADCLPVVLAVEFASPARQTSGVQWHPGSTCMFSSVVPA
jgi:hypothetical protein